MDSIFLYLIYLCFNIANICILLVPSAAPNNIVTSVVNSTAILLTWDAPDPTDRNGILLFYTLTYFGVELDEVVRVVNHTIVGSNHSNQSYVFTELQEYTVYEFSVASFTTIGKGTATTVEQRTSQSGMLLCLCIFLYLFSLLIFFSSFC